MTPHLEVVFTPDEPPATPVDATAMKDNVQEVVGHDVKVATHVGCTVHSGMLQEVVVDQFAV